MIGGIIFKFIYLWKSYRIFENLPDFLCKVFLKIVCYDDFMLGISNTFSSPRIKG
jgi:hypothetical protein